MTTFVVSIGCITEEATLPESEPTMKGLPYSLKNEIYFLGAGVVDVVVVFVAGTVTVTTTGCWTGVEVVLDIFKYMN
jgi:hypothetical protein